MRRRSHMNEAEIAGFPGISQETVKSTVPRPVAKLQIGSELREG